MYVAKQIVYLQMQKTGSTHVTTTLKKYCGGRSQGKHEQLTNYEKFKDRTIVSSVRNPWDWYVSLWAYGCSGRGGLRKYLMRVPFSEIEHAAKYRSVGATSRAVARMVTNYGRRPDWKNLYSDAANEKNFRAWLRLVLGPEGQNISKEGYSASAIKSAVGFMTYRFLSLSTHFEQWQTKGQAARNYEEVLDFAADNTIAQQVLKMESLDADLHILLRSVGYEVTQEDLAALEKTNTSNHRKYDDYYDDETHELVARRDRFIVEKFGYKILAALSLYPLADLLVYAEPLI